MESAPSTPVVARVTPKDVLLADAGLERVNGVLYMGGVSLAAIAREAGTPAYVYNADAIRERYVALDRALAPVPHRICYAVKANGNLAVLDLLQRLGAGADIVSGGELHRALRAGFPAGRIVFSGVGKTDAELALAIEHGVGHINLESSAELAALEAVAGRASRPVAVGIRVNPDVTAETHPYISTGQSGIKFGIPADQVPEVAARVAAHPRLTLTGIAMHLGSQIASAGPYLLGIRKLLDLVGDIRATGVDTVRVLDIGGGIGIPYRDAPGMNLEGFAREVVPPLVACGLTVYMEPGRFLVGSAGVLLATVIYRKYAGGKEFVIVDTGMNDLMRPTLYQAHHEIVPLEAGPGDETPMDVVGPVCETGDFLALDRPLPPLRRGDAIALLGAGAYGFVMSSNYNARPRAAEVLVDGGRHAVVRARESVEDLMRGETLNPFS